MVIITMVIIECLVIVLERLEEIKMSVRVDRIICISMGQVAFERSEVKGSIMIRLGMFEGLEVAGVMSCECIRGFDLIDLLGRNLIWIN